MKMAEYAQFWIKKTRPSSTRNFPFRQLSESIEKTKKQSVCVYTNINADILADV